jgi:predicted RNA binding protein YcfA (HicA-like mRNA interferase family)
VSKLPVVSGAECVKALGKIGFELYRQRGSHFVLVRKSPPAQTTIPNHKSWIEVRCALSSAKLGLQLKNSLHCSESKLDLQEWKDVVQ